MSHSTQRMETRIGARQPPPVASTSSVKSFQGVVTKWEKKWVPVGHLRLLKWVPVRPRKKDRKGFGRPFNDNAPITRSITSSNKMVKAALIGHPQQPVKIRRNPEREARATAPIVEPDEMDDLTPPTPTTPPQPTKETPPPTTPVSPTSPPPPPSVEDKKEYMDDDEEYEPKTRTKTHQSFETHHTNEEDDERGN